MRIIFSRKGFDSSAGGVPSPIIGGRPHSLPIPTRMPTVTRFRDLGNGTAALVDDLTNGRLSSDQPCHLDPDLDAGALSRPPGWRGALGQVSAAQSHLLNVLIQAHLVQLVLSDCCHQVYVPIKVERPVPVELVRCL